MKSFEYDMVMKSFFHGLKIEKVHHDDYRTLNEARAETRHERQHFSMQTYFISSRENAL